MSETKLAVENFKMGELTPIDFYFRYRISGYQRKISSATWISELCRYRNKRSIEVRCDIMAVRSKSNLNWLNNTIYGYLRHLKVTVDPREISGATLRNYIKPIKLFFQQTAQKFYLFLTSLSMPTCLHSWLLTWYYFKWFRWIRITCSQANLSLSLS